MKLFSRNVFVSLLCASFLAGCGTRIGGPADVEYDSMASPYHVVKRGETIASIAKRYHMEKREVARLNGLKPPFRIMVGQKLLVRTFSSKKSAADMYDEPATESGPIQTEGEIKVNKLAPLPGTEEPQEETTMKESQPFEATQTQGEGQGKGENEDEKEFVETEETTKTPESEKTAAKGLPKTPKNAAFFSWPVRGKIIKGYDDKKGGNNGINIAAPKGTPVGAANNGVVARTEHIPGFGKLVVIRHDGGYLSVYAHLDEIRVKRGDVIEAGQRVGSVGTTGVKEPQLHFELRQGKKPLDPSKYLD